MIQTKGVIKGTPDKDTYECEIEVDEYGTLKGIPTRFVNEPKDGDEVWCIVFDEIFNNECIYIPLNILKEQFIGMARQGFKMEFKDDEIQVTSKQITIDIKKDKLEIGTASGNIKLEGDRAEVSGFSAGFKLGGTVAPTGSGPFCGISNCLFTGAPHVGDTATGN